MSSPMAASRRRARAGCSWAIPASPRLISAPTSLPQPRSIKAPAWWRYEVPAVTVLSMRNDNDASADLGLADREALARMHAVRPTWRGVTLARDAMAFPDRTILHAGPPARPGSIAQPLANSAVMAILFEGWAK